MIKIICIDNKELGHRTLKIDKTDELTIGKIYYGWIEGQTYTIINDKGRENGYFMERFKTMEEVREEKINKILG